MSTFDSTPAQATEAAGPRSTADRRGILVVVALLAVLFAIGFLPPQAESHAQPATPVASGAHPTVNGPLVIEMDGASFRTTRGGDLLGCSDGAQRTSSEAVTRITLTCADGPRTGVITARLFGNDKSGLLWRVEHGTGAFRMLSGSGVVSASSGGLTGQIWFGGVDHGPSATGA